MSVAARIARTVATIQAHRSFGSAKRPRTKLPRQIPPKLIEREYGAALGELVGKATRAAFEPLLAELPRIIMAARTQLKHDMNGFNDPGRRDVGDEIARARALIEEAKRRLAGSISKQQIEALARKFAARTSSYQRIQLARQTKAALGIDLFASDSKIPAIAETFVQANVSLITNLPQRIAGEVENAVTTAVQTGTLHGDLAEELEAKFSFGENRAKLIARDQIGKLYGQINASRQQDLGVTQFVWNTVGDERVRDEHDERDGETFDYDDPPDGELPGEPILCRCWAEPVFDDIVDDADDSSDNTDED